MPTYEFICGHCGHHFDEFLPITSGSNKKCPICGKMARKKVSGGIGLIFKGPGFYATDYAKKDKPGK